EARSMAKHRGTHLSTPLNLLGSDRDAVLPGDPGAAAPGEGARYLVTRAGAVTLSEGEDGTLRAVLEQEDPREGAQQPLVLLGRREGYRVLAAEIGEPSAELDAPGRDLRDLRRVADRLADSDADLAAAAVAMGAWHRSTRHCPQCGGVLEPEMAGWVLRCREDGTEHFPRTDPAVIMAVRDGRDRLVLARCVEPGESLENAVAREVAEEVGITVEEVQYMGSQPWPFPRSLMLGYRAWAPDAAELALQEDEIAEARWFSREQLAAALEA